MVSAERTNGVYWYTYKAIWEGMYGYDRPHPYNNYRKQVNPYTLQDDLPKFFVCTNARRRNGSKAFLQWNCHKIWDFGKTSITIVDAMYGDSNHDAFICEYSTVKKIFFESGKRSAWILYNVREFTYLHT